MNTLTNSKYTALVADIGRLYEDAQQALVQAYWKIGQRIVEVAQKGAARAPHGDGLLERLSSDLSAQYGTGFSVPNLERMRTFYLTHPKSSAPRKLDWTQYVEIMPVEDAKVRRQLERRAESEGLSSRTLRKLVREETGTAAVPVTSEPTVTRVVAPEPEKSGKPLRRPGNLKLHVYTKAVAPGVAIPKDHVLVDCGFDVYRMIRQSIRGLHLSAKPSYTYPAIVERVVDGDTVWAFIDVGFGTIRREKLRMHGIDAPEVRTARGEEARDYVARLLPPGAAMVIRSYASDGYGRYLADIFCFQEPVTKPSANTYQHILSSSMHLNQDLLGRRLAVRTVL
jgi:hypothetical protein